VFQYMNQLGRAIAVMELLADKGELSLAGVARELRTSRPTAYRLLTALQDGGYIEHQRARRTYRLGSALHALAARATASTLIHLAEPALADLLSAFGETVNLAIVRRNRLVYITILDGRRALRMSATVGQDVPAHATGLGKAILAMLSEPRRDAILGPEPYIAYTERTITNRQTLARALAVAREQGYAVDDGEAEVGAACVAAAIIGGDGLPVGAISVSGLAVRFSELQWVAIGRAVRDWADRISLDLSALGEGKKDW
jgi:IclR family acetate operon transcriptional repressor